MTTVTVRIPTPLRRFTDGANEVHVEGRNVGEVLSTLAQQYQELVNRILTEDGTVRQFVTIYLGSEDVRNLEGMDTSVSEGDVLSIIPAVAGGGRMRAKDRRLAELKGAIPAVSPRDAFALQKQGATLIDIREADEIAQGSPAGAHRLSRSFLELKIEDIVPDLEHTLLLACGSGTRSLFAAEELRRLGYRDVRSVAGGFNGWKNAGLPFEIPRLLSTDARERYSRHLLMPEVGEHGQLKLLGSKVLLVGAGGLGSPAALYLAAAGVGTLGILDHDVVDRSNLQRQILHSESRVGISKVTSARAGIEALNPGIKVLAHETYLNGGNVEETFSGYDVIVDGSDNFATRYLVNDACVQLGLPNVHGSVYRFEGQVTVFWPGYHKRRGPCYRCLYAEPPPPEMAPSCAEAGVLGILPGVIGLLQAAEVIKILLGIGELLVGKLLYYDALQARFSELTLKPNPDCQYCRDDAKFPGYVDYQAFCAASNV